jgi:hypothetical protein
MQAESPSLVPSSSETPEQLVRRLLLIEGRRHLNREERRAVLALGAEAVPPLIAMLTDASLQPEDSPGDGYARERAASLLGDLGAVEAIEPMLDVLRTTDGLTATHEAVLEAIVRLGPAVLEPVLLAYAGSTDPKLRFSLASALSRMGHHDPRILSALVEYLPENPDHGAGCLADYGDPAALPALHAALAAQPVDRSPSLLGNHEIIELCAAIEDLGGTLAPSQEAKRAQVDALRERQRAELFRTPVQRNSKIGRNDPCPCGSGKKYKKCCGA